VQSNVDPLVRCQNIYDLIRQTHEDTDAYWNVLAYDLSHISYAKYLREIYRREHKEDERSESSSGVPSSIRNLRRAIDYPPLPDRKVAPLSSVRENSALEELEEFRIKEEQRIMSESKIRESRIEATRLYREERALASSNKRLDECSSDEELNDDGTVYDPGN